MSPSLNSGVSCALIISLAIDQTFCFAPSIKPPIEPVVSSTKQTSMRGLDFGVGAFVANDGCQKPRVAEADRIIDRMPMLGVISVFIVLLFSDFINGVVELEHDVLTQGQPRAGLGMFCQEVEVFFGVKLDALSFGGVLRVRVDPL